MNRCKRLIADTFAKKWRVRTYQDALPFANPAGLTVVNLDRDLALVDEEQIEMRPNCRANGAIVIELAEAAEDYLDSSVRWLESDLGLTSERLAKLLLISLVRLLVYLNIVTIENKTNALAITIRRISVRAVNRQTVMH